MIGLSKNPMPRLPGQVMPGRPMVQPAMGGGMVGGGGMARPPMIGRQNPQAYGALLRNAVMAGLKPRGR